MKNPDFVLFVGPMFGGKTTRLLAALDRYHHQKRIIAAFKPKIDERYGSSSINTHTGGRLAAKKVCSGIEIEECILNSDENPDVVAVDEAFMIPGSGKSLINLYKAGITVVASTLQLASTGNPYDEIKEMMPWATKIEVCPALCTACGADAFFTTKTGGKPEDEIEVGGSELYEPRCARHFTNLNEFNI